MKVTVSLEVRFEVLPDGSVWTISNYHSGFWERYLKVFDQVEIVARAYKVTNVPNEAKRVDRYPKITFKGLPFYIGPYQYAMKWREIRSELNKIIQGSEAVILRVGSPIADIMLPILLRRKHPFIVEVVGDPWDTLSPGSIKSFLRPFLRRWLTHKLKKQVRNSIGASYVTSVRLPERYPVQEGGFKIFASSIELKKEHLSPSPKVFDLDKKSFQLISTGALEDWRKGPDVAFKAMKILKEKGFELKLTWLGDGRARGEIEALAQQLGLKDDINFMGQLSAGSAIFAELDKADIFILPTRGEGLPRALIEAMARGLPAIGSDVGGIPELLDGDLIHQPGNHEELAEKLQFLLTTPGLLNSSSARNWKRAHDYLNEELETRRTSLYQFLRKKTYEWKNSSSR